MKRISLIFILIPVFIIALLFSTFSNNKELKPVIKVGYNFIKCTPPKFQFGVVDSTKQIAPLFENLGDLSFKISTENELAQTFFNQGMKLAYAFNHAEAHRSFMEASRLDPKSAMSYWGQAYVLGPNINDPLPDDERKQKSNEALVKAVKLAASATPKEQALIKALEARYNSDLTVDIGHLNMAYLKAMETVLSSYPSDANINILYAEAAMNTVPWNYWDENGTPSPNIQEAKLALEKAMLLDPENPGAHHYYIHMVELPFPDLGVPSADILGSLMPAAGHIVHMPSHIYIRVGRYKDAVIANKAAILADEDYISQCYSQGLYPLGYYPHNIHFLWSAASLLGSSDEAIDAAKKTAERVPTGELVAMPFLQDFAATPLLAYVRFGKWNDILTIPAPNANIKHLSLIRHYARGMAFIRKKNLKEAKEELDAIGLLKEDPELSKLMAVAQNTSDAIANIAYEVIAGELASAEGNVTKAIKHLENAIKLEDALTYTEPSAWHIPVRQNLGAILLHTGKLAEAEMIYKEDLKVLRQNGWSLMGLYNVYMAQGKTNDAKLIRKEFESAWQYSDIKIDQSVL
ncbi:hypothetical protein ATE92_0743 [Ulvibacter sp. MAR_2010_11]|uniref:tetratricopeptide repeat protein n=1 Tax=Ulvibacter sp. MAR_2010_11 TaxID=1250229 RepID=UPI000C2CCFB2|nr:hypothetical protein [Ulvibacter sp. MAR_2010_11]PKA82610.1 hypothetical protein ATE92_0743 [Ulvibacter sp. MAR_2010_11]